MLKFRDALAVANRLLPMPAMIISSNVLPAFLCSAIMKESGFVPGGSASHCCK